MTSAGNGGLSDELMMKLKNSSVTTIVDTSIETSASQFDEFLPRLVGSVQAGLSDGISGLETASEGIDQGIAGQRASGAPAMALADLESQRAEITETIGWMEEMSAAVPGVFAQAETDYADEIRVHADSIARTYQLEVNKGYRNVFIFYGLSALAMLGLLALVPNKKEAAEKSASIRGSHG